METSVDKNKIIELGQLDSSITEILHMIDYIPEDIQRCKNEIEHQNTLLAKMEQRRKIVEEKIEECTKLKSLETERANKADEIMSMSRNQQSYLIAKRHREKSGKVFKQVEQAIQTHSQTLEQIKESITESAAKLKTLQSTHDLGEKSMKAGRGNLKAELKVLRDKEKAVRATIDTEFLAKFDHLSSCGYQPVVISVDSNKCSACQMTFPDRIFQELLHGGLHACPNCQRYMTTSEPETAKV